MTWLLAQMGLVLLLAAVAGWFVGWYLRAFHDHDRLEDLRQTMVATRDVKDRELAELRRKVDDLQARFARANDRGARMLDVRGSAAATTLESPRETTESPPPAPSRRASPDQEAARPRALADAELTDPEESSGIAAAERERRRESEADLRLQNATLLAAEAEIEALREAVAEKATRIAELQDELVELEPADRELESAQGTVVEIQVRLRALEEEREKALGAIAASEEQLLEARKEIVIRDTRINDLRNRCGTLETELADARIQDGPAAGDEVGRLESGLEEAQRALQRQIERNRKQEAVHRAVVEQLESDKARLREPGERNVTDLHAHSARRGLPQKRSDELTQISGIGPVFAKAMREAGIDTYAQIAAWDDPDIERYAATLGTNARRIRADRWVEQAHELARTSRAHRT